MPPHRGGVERVTQQLAQLYAHAGHDVRWVATDAGATGEGDADGSVRLERVPAYNGLERSFGMPYPIPSPGGLARIARAAGGADVVHLHDCLYLPVITADRSARRAGVPTIVTQHVGMVSFGGAVDPLLFAAYRTVGRAVLRHAARVAFVNEGVREWFRERIDPALRSEHIPNAVDLARFRPVTADERVAARRGLGIRSDAPLVLFVGRLVAKKNLSVVADALASLPDPWHALVVGDGPQRGVLAGLGGRCTHLADLRHAEMPRAYAAADVFTLPSRDEGTPLTVLEAMASGLPCVVSDDRAFAELASCMGVVRVRPTASELARALAGLLADPDRRSAAGAAARAWAEANYAEERIGARYLAIVEELTAPGSRGQRASPR